LQANVRNDWVFQSTRLTDEYTFEQFSESRVDGSRMVLWRKQDGRLVFASNCAGAKPQKNDVILTFTPPRPEKPAQPTKDDIPDPALPA
ncbi:MAG: sodium:proton antiporter, partial [Pseudomonadota bacterium]